MTLPVEKPIEPEIAKFSVLNKPASTSAFSVAGRRSGVRALFNPACDIIEKGIWVYRSVKRKAILQVSNTKYPKPVIALDCGKVLIDYDHSLLIDRLSELSGHLIESGTLSKMEEVNAAMQRGEIPWNQAIKILNRSLCIHVSERDWIELYTGVLQHEVPGMRETLTELKKDYRLVVLSNTDEIHWPYLLKNFSIFALLDDWVISHEEKVAKPDPAIYQLFMKRYCNNGVPAFFTDDMPENVATARELGWRAEIFVDSAHFVEQIKCIHP